METVESGWNTLAGTTPENILQAVEETSQRKPKPFHQFGTGRTAEEIVKILKRTLR